MAEEVESYDEEKFESENDTTEIVEKVKKEIKQGCRHYKCRCAYISPCCGKEYVCRVCHDEAESHEIDRFSVTQIVCLLCRHAQSVAKECEKCSVSFGNYFCGICRMWDDNEKKQFHCTKCGICRVGGRENFFHCDKCDYCLDKSLKDSHTCVEKVSRGDCPVCLEDLHSSRQQLAVFPCGHICHMSCRNGLLKTGNYSCPLCCRSICDMSPLWREIDNEIENVPMPEEYQNTKFWILCRDCHKVSETAFHVLGLKCVKCGSYNTCREANPNEPNTPLSEPPTPFVNPLATSTHLHNLLINSPTTSLSSHDLFYDAQSSTLAQDHSASASHTTNSGNIPSTAPTATSITTATNITTTTSITATTSIAITNSDLPMVIRSNLYSTSAIPSGTNTTLSNEYPERVPGSGDVVDGSSVDNAS